MATESKKLRTKYPIGRVRSPAQFFDCIHDAEVAHEQREVIRKLVEVLTECVEEDELQGYSVPHLRDALAAAAPYLED